MDNSYHIVIADDDDDDQLLMSDAIRSILGENVKISSVYDGDQLLDFLQKKGIYENTRHTTPSLVLLDINMPVMHGIDTLTRIRTLPEYKQLPVFIISTVRDPEKLAQCVELGANNCYSKPNVQAQYKTILDEIFSKTLFATPT